MKVTEGELTTYEPLPTEQSLYLSAYRYPDGLQWFGGPSGRDKQVVIDMMKNYSAYEVRIYHVRLPIIKAGDKS